MGHWVVESFVAITKACETFMYHALQSHHHLRAADREAGREAVLKHGARLWDVADRRAAELLRLIEADVARDPDQASVTKATLRRMLHECLFVLKTGNVGQGEPVSPLRAWLDTTFRDAVLDDERVMKSAAMLKVGMERGDPGVEVCRRFLADFVKTLVEEGGNQGGVKA